MKAMIFCAGLGTRLRPITDTLPKALLPLGGKTLLQHQIERLQAAGISDIVINVHHLPDQIVRFLQQHNNFGCRIAVSDESNRLLNTGGGLLKATPLLCGDSEPVLACNVDILSNIDIPAFVCAHRPDAMATLVVSDRRTQRYLLFDGEDRMRGWTNIATGEVRPRELQGLTGGLRPLAFSGMQILSPQLFPLLQEYAQAHDAAAADSQRGVFSLIDLYVGLCSRHTLRAYVPDGYRMMDVGKIGQLQEAERFAENL